MKKLMILVLIALSISGKAQDTIKFYNCAGELKKEIVTNKDTITINRWDLSWERFYYVRTDNSCIKVDNIDYTDKILIDDKVIYVEIKNKNHK